MSADDLQPLRQLILERYAPVGTACLDEGTSLVASGWIDSFGLVEIVAYIEKKYRVRLREADILPRHFESLAAIRQVLARASRP